MLNTHKIIAPKTRALLHKALDDKGLSPRDLAQSMDNAYDNIRSIVQGQKFGSKLMMQAIAATLKMDEAYLIGVWAEDKRLLEAERGAKPPDRGQ
jgi:hypothetical protein